VFFCDIGEKKTLFHPEIIVFFFTQKKVFLFFAYGSRLVADLILKNSVVFALSLHQTISENSAFWPKQKKSVFL